MLVGKSKVILLLVDSLGYEQFLSFIRASDSILSHYINDSIFLPLTSTFSSTTPTALTSLNTGLTPQEHAVTGYSVYLKNYDLITNMIDFTPLIENRNDILTKGVLDPSKFLGAKTIFEVLREEDNKCQVVTRSLFKDSPLTKMLHKGADIETYFDTSNLFITLKRLIELKPYQNSYIFAYWDTLDTVSHVHGPSSNEAKAEIKRLLYFLKTDLLDRLERDHAKNSILLVTSDHGHHKFVNNRILSVEEHPNFFGCLQIPPTGSSRSAYLYLKPNKHSSVINYLEKHYGSAFLLLDSKDALQRGLFGRGEVAQETSDRIGDLIALPKEGYSIYYPYNRHRKHIVLKGGHGGLSEDEMLVPLLAIPLS